MKKHIYRGKRAFPRRSLRRVARAGSKSYIRKKWLEDKYPVPKILVVDDDPDLLAICSIVLESEGYNVDAARNGYEAVDKLSHDGVDLILLDVMMPVMDGLSVCKMVKRDPNLKDLPVIIMSTSESLRERGKGCADAVLAKPFDLDRLVETVSSLAPAI